MDKEPKQVIDDVAASIVNNVSMDADIAPPSLSVDWQHAVESVVSTFKWLVDDGKSLADLANLYDDYTVADEVMESAGQFAEAYAPPYPDVIWDFTADTRGYWLEEALNEGIDDLQVAAAEGLWRYYVDLFTRAAEQMSDGIAAYLAA